jgi:iron complex outermembrane recepter protein
MKTNLCLTLQRLQRRASLHVALVYAVAMTLTVAAPCQGANRDLADLSLEQLAEIVVTSVSGRGQPLSDAAASIYVITNDDIRRSGAVTLPEALRLAPNLQVARVNASQYAITARGSNNAIGNKLLVLVDGRTVYAPFFSGVLWDMQDVILEDVDRIEVISGPGGTLWGTNAVNGVINVVTRSSALTAGPLAVASLGTRERMATIRYGTGVGSGHVRGFFKTTRIENTQTSAGADIPDRFERLLAGVRGDWSTATEELSMQANASHGRSQFRGFRGTFALTPIEYDDFNVLALWKRRFADGSDLQLQGYFDHSRRDDAFLWRPSEDILDVTLQHAIPLGDHRLLWGGGYRRAREDLQPGLNFAFVPQESTLSWISLFAQDRWKLTSTVDATIGARLEHNDYTGNEVLPNARLSWKANADSLLWTAVSRAVRAPAPLDRTIRFPPSPPYVIAGGPDFHSEAAMIYELGYRGRPTQAITLSVTAHHERWRGLRSGQTPPNAMIQNKINGTVNGVELWAVWQATETWRVTGGMASLNKHLRLDPDSTDPVGPSNMGNDPRVQWMVRSSFNLPARQELDVAVRRVSSLPVPVVPAYTALDLRYGWRVRRDVELSVVIRNVFDPSHPEYEAAPGRSEFGRSALVQLKWTP